MNDIINCLVIEHVEKIKRFKVCFIDKDENDEKERRNCKFHVKLFFVTFYDCLGQKGAKISIKIY